MTEVDLDKTDICLLNLLQNDGELTYKELAAKVKRSKSNVVERIRKMRSNGIIAKQVVLIDVQKLRTIFTAFPHIQLKVHGEDALAEFKKLMAGFPEVMECYHVTGEYDFMLKIVTSDMLSYNQFLTAHISSNHLVGKVQSFLVLSQSKRETAYPL